MDSLTSENVASRRFGAAFRVKRRTEFLRIQNTGKKTRTEHFLLISKPNELQHSRIGITITRKVDKRAVVRNRVKRHVREFFRCEQSNIKSAHDIVIVALRGSNELCGSEAHRELRQLFGKARSLRFGGGGERET